MNSNPSGLDQFLIDQAKLDDVIAALAAGLPPAFADGHQIQQVLLNLIINAEHAMLDAHGRGMLILRSWHEPDRDAVELLDRQLLPLRLGGHAPSGSFMR